MSSNRCSVEQTFSERLEEERKRLELNQDDAALIVNRRRQAWAAWERGETSPDARELDLLAARGFDVVFLLTGDRSPELLSRDESQLLDDVRGMDDRARRMLRAMVDAWHGWAPRAMPTGSATAVYDARPESASAATLHDVALDRKQALPGERVKLGRTSAGRKRTV
ncbi:helix-turn-helix transcriptional regulator [Methyloversatilis sp.]|uniref:helix-turn-helix transcriptional regulator n=1 Tax=Methyloversatilis sp. TaxID=2569862 RepID=UPI002734C3A3|nr:helix-turn-helix transcriptional regulator [Methyloversatilis sp.]MDP3579123.1 helix-turn-helix transcriptional regulator [Methyloversatilis sp.]